MACHKAFLMSKNMGVETAHKYWTQSTLTRTESAIAVFMQGYIGVIIGHLKK